jgi:hypothetical protein
VTGCVEGAGEPGSRNKISSPSYSENQFVEADQALLSVGQITSVFQKSCQAPESKIFRFTFLEIRIISTAVSSPRRGVGHRHQTLGWDAVDAAASGAFFALDEALSAYGEVVWSWRRDAGAKLAGGIPPMTVTTSPLTGESTK